MAFGIEPAVELNVAQPNMFGPEFVPDFEECTGVSQSRLEIVIIARAMIRPITEVFQRDIGVVAGTPLAGNISQEAATGRKGAVNAGLDHKHIRLNEPRRNLLRICRDRAQQLIAGAERQSRVHVVAGWRENKRVSLIVEEYPGTVTPETVEAVAAKFRGVAQMVKLARIGSKGRERFGCASGCPEHQLEQDNRAIVVDADRAEPCASAGSFVSEYELPIGAGAVPARSGSDV